METTPRGRAIVISGPSGSGKTTLVRRLLAGAAPMPLKKSVSATTRPPRPAEVDGVDYHFLSPREFERRRQAGDFLECFEVFGRGHWYGTLRGEVAPSLAAGKWVLLEVDVHGAMAIVGEFPDAVTIFVRHPGGDDVSELERRLLARGTEDREALGRRLEVARRELAEARQFRYQVVNEEVERAVREIQDILTAEERVHAR